MKLYRPVIVTPTKWSGCAFCCVAPTEKYAFRMLERRLADGRIDWRPIGER